MSMLTLAISCLTTSNLPWFMDQTFQVPMQYCSLLYWTLVPSPVTFTTVCCFCFGSVSSFFLELFLHWFPVAYWAPADLGSSSFNVLSFCLFILFMGFSRREYWNGLPFPSPVDHIWSELSTMTRPSWIALCGGGRGGYPLGRGIVYSVKYNPEPQNLKQVNQSNSRKLRRQGKAMLTDASFSPSLRCLLETWFENGEDSWETLGLQGNPT